MAGEFPGLPNFGYGAQIPAEAILQMLPFTPQYAEAQQARKLDEARLQQMAQTLYQNADLHPLLKQLTQGQIGAQTAATDASKAQAGRTRAETPTGVDRMLGRSGVLAEIMNRLAQSGYYKTMGNAQESEQLNALMQQAPLFDTVEEDVEVPGWLGGSSTEKRTRQVPGAIRSSILQKLLQKSRISVPQQPPQQGSNVQPGMAEAYATAKEQALGSKQVQPQTQPQAQAPQGPTSTMRQLPTAVVDQLGAAGSSVFKNYVEPLYKGPTWMREQPQAQPSAPKAPSTLDMQYMGVPVTPRAFANEYPTIANAVQNPSMDTIMALLRKAGIVTSGTTTPVDLNPPPPPANQLPVGWMDMLEKKQKGK